ncbi:MAG: branched-chain amino acid transport system ATP-binding protein, partial [Actinomycetota bacterium]|nr:branched-chain amino acid transport system ATP-binding protein [Actinomycetota bacterium]
ASLGLSPVAIDTTFSALREIADQGTAVLLVEQNARASLGVADRGYLLEKGRVVLEGTAASLLADPAVTASYLGAGV